MKYTDAEEREALLDGAFALRLHAKLVASRTSEPAPAVVREALAQLDTNADVLEEMAACYEQRVSA